MIGQRVDDYLVVDLLGAGGFGKVFLALQAPIWMKTAFKQMNRNPDDSALSAALARKFLGEAQALATLTHPNIVRLLKYGSWNECPYLVMEFVENGQSLKQMVTDLVVRGEELGLAVSARILGQILDALAAAHAKGIVHRDIKPDNVMLQEVGSDKHFVRVLDFGLAKYVCECADTSMMSGTPMYMAPEQLGRKGLGPWTDLYAVGAVAFELMTGRKPFEGRTAQEVLGKKLDPTYDPASRLEPGCPEFIAAFFRRALARDPGERFRTAAEFRAALDGMMARMMRNGGRDPSSSTDLSGLVDPAEVARLRAEKDQLKRDMARQQQEWQAERRLLEVELAARRAADLVREADSLWGSSDERREKGPHEQDALFTEKYLPRYQIAIAEVTRAISEGAPDIVEGARMRKAAYEASLALACLSILFAFARRADAMTEDDGRRASELLAMGRDWIRSAVEVAEHWSLWFNVGTFEEFSGDFPAALAALRKAVEAAPDEKVAGTLRASIRRLEAGEGHAFPLPATGAKPSSPPPRSDSAKAPAGGKVSCHWGHTRMESRLRSCTDGRSVVCPICCFLECARQYPALFSECSSRDFPVWKPGEAASLPGRSRPVFPETSKVCYWGHTRDSQRIRPCRDGKNFVCPTCCHEDCVVNYPGMYRRCMEEGWPAWSPDSVPGGASSTPELERPRKVPVRGDSSVN